MKVCFVASEIFPFSKTGGLADVVAALSRKLAEEGMDVRVFSPLYSTVDPSPLTDVEPARELPLPGGRRASASLRLLRDPESRAPCYFVDSPEFFRDRSIYTEDEDEPERFAALCHAALLGCQALEWSPDIIHCHDWQTGLIPLYLRTVFAGTPLFSRTRTILTIHNLGYQGVFSSDRLAALLPGEFHHFLDADDLAQGRINLLKTGLRHADCLTTVSPTYAREIQTAEYGSGLDALLRERSSHLRGILNGVDYGEWCPERDPHLFANYSRRAPMQAKQANRRELLREVGLPFEPGIPTAGVISRLVWQKGFDLLEGPIPRLLREDRLQLVALGSGEARYEAFFADLAREYPRAARFVRGYNPALAHRIEAGTDLFLMPSRYEPCGLNQLYSLRYGTAPVVRKTGGLADTVIHFDSESGEGTGFVFEHFTSDGLSWALDRALEVFPNREAWRRLVRNAMARDFSWDRSVAEYLELYREICPGT